MEQGAPYKAVALVVGVTGMAGLALAEALKKPSARGGPWRVYGSARRAKPDWFPSSAVDLYISFDAMDPCDTGDKLSPVAAEVTHVFWVAIQVQGSEEDNLRANEVMLANVLRVLRSNPGSKLTHISLQTGTQYYMGPIHFLCTQPRETPFREDLPRVPYPNFYYAQEDLVASHAPPLTYSIHRSSIILGASSRSAYNAMLTMAAYAAICRHDGSPFRFPGTRYTWEHFCDATDARVLAEQHIWAATTDAAKNQAFNCTNGDVFTWKSLWKALCEVLAVDFVDLDEEDAFDFVGFMKEKGKVWDEIVDKHGLYKTKLEEITCAAAIKTVLHFGFQHVCDMNKSRQFGFFGYADTLKSLGFWVERLRQMKIIPPT